MFTTLGSVNGYNGLSTTPKDNNPANIYAAQMGAERSYNIGSIPTNLYSKGNILSTYNAFIDLYFMNEKIKQEQISYILIDNEYDSHTMPIIYVSLAVTNSMYDSMLANKDIATFYLDIKLNNTNSSLSISKKIFSGEFTYIPSATNPNYAEVLDKSNEFFSNAYKRIIVGLVSTELNNAARKEFNNIYKDITCETLLTLALDGINAIVETPTYNDWYESIIVPPMTSRNQLISYLYNKNQFYDTDYRFFMDFDYCYLLSNAGNLISDGKGNPEDIIIDIKELTDRAMIENGYYISNNSYYIPISPGNTNILFDQSTDKISNNIISVSDEGIVSQIGLNINATYGSSQKNFYIRDTNTTLYKNELETDTVALEFVKQHVDPSIFTPNKTISIRNNDSYSEYNGKYIMKYKKTFFNCTAGSFIVSVLIGLKKVNNLIPKARLNASEKPLVNVSRSYSASRSTSSSLYNESGTTRKNTNTYNSPSASIKYSSDNRSSTPANASRKLTIR